MRKSKFTDEQIIAILAEQERGMATADVCRRHGISSANFYKWKSKYGGLARSPVALIQPEWARTGAGRAFRALAMLITTSGVVFIPFLSGRIIGLHAASFSFMAGVMPPMPMFGRSLL